MCLESSFFLPLANEKRAMHKEKSHQNQFRKPALSMWLKFVELFLVEGPIFIENFFRCARKIRQNQSQKKIPTTVVYFSQLSSDWSDYLSADWEPVQSLWWENRTRSHSIGWDLSALVYYWEPFSKQSTLNKLWNKCSNTRGKKNQNFF